MAGGLNTAGLFSFVQILAGKDAPRPGERRLAIAATTVGTEAKKPQLAPIFNPEPGMILTLGIYGIKSFLP
jgi:hypothetical protein